jgi:hypothetical protein
MEPSSIETGPVAPWTAAWPVARERAGKSIDLAEAARLRAETDDQAAPGGEGLRTAATRSGARIGSHTRRAAMVTGGLFLRSATSVAGLF